MGAISQFLQIAFQRVRKQVGDRSPIASNTLPAILPASEVIPGWAQAITAKPIIDPNTSEPHTQEAVQKFINFITPYVELLEVFDPKADRNPMSIAENLRFIHSFSGRIPTPLEVLVGEGVEVFARYDNNSRDPAPGLSDHTVILVAPAQPDTLARVTTVLAKYGLVPDNLLSMRRSVENMNIVLDINGIPKETVQRFTEFLRQRLAVDVPGENIRLYSRPATQHNSYIREEQHPQ